MSGLMWLPVAIALAAALMGSLAHRQLPPPLAARLLAVSIMSASLGVACALVLAVAAVAMQAPWFNNATQWCDMLVASHHRIPAVLGVASAFALIVGLVRMVRWLVHRRHVIRSLQSASAPVELIPTKLPAAFAVPGRPGHIVVSQGMLDVLDEPQRAALLAHEQAHLDLHHDRYVLVAEAAARAVPLLHPLRRRVRFCTERWADEVAATVVGNRRTVAEAISRAAMTGATFSGHGSLDLTGNGVAARVTELLRTDRRGTLGTTTAAAALIGVATVSTTASAVQFRNLLALVLHIC